MFADQIRARMPVLLAALLSGAAGLAGCAAEDFEREPVFEESAAPPVSGQSAVYRNRPGASGGQAGPAFEEEYNYEDIGTGTDGLYDVEIGPGFDELYGNEIYGEEIYGSEPEEDSGEGIPESEEY